MNLSLCINQGIDFIEKKEIKKNVVYYCNDLRGNVVQERIKKMELPCDNKFEFYEGDNYVDFKESEKIIGKKVEASYEVFVVGAF